MSLCIDLGITEWRQGKYNFKKIKQLFRKSQQTKRSTSKDPDKKIKREQLIIDAHNEYLTLAETIIEKAEQALYFIETDEICLQIKIDEILKYVGYAEKFIDQINKRVIHGFKRYVSMGMLAMNLQILGHAIQQKELKRQKKK